MLLLAMLMVFCQGAWAAKQKIYKYYLPNGTEVSQAKLSTTKRVVVYEFVDNIMMHCKAYREEDFAGSTIDLVIPNTVSVIGSEALGGSVNGSLIDYLRSVTFPKSLTYVNNYFMGDAKYPQLERLDFTKCGNLEKVGFGSNAFGGCQSSMAGAVVDFTDPRCGLSYSIDISTGEMSVTGFQYQHSQIVALGQMDLGGLVGRLTSLGGFFKGYTAHEFSIAVTDGLKGIEAGALQGSSITALSLPKSYGAQYFKTSETSCGAGFMDGCSKLGKVYIFAFNVPYILKRNSSGTYDISYDTSAADACDFGVTADAGHGYALDERDFSYRWPNLKGDIGVAPDFEFPKGTLRDFSAYSVSGTLFKGNTAITGLTIYNSFLGQKQFRDVSNYAFSGCTGLKTLKVDTSVGSLDMSLSSNCFEGCTSLTDITLGNRVSNVGNYCFKDCSALKNISLEKSDEGSKLYLGVNSFEGCTSLQKADLRGRWIDNLPTGCFEGCSSLTTLMFDHDVLALWKDFDLGTQLNTVFFTHVDAGVTYDYIWTSAGSVALIDGETFRGQNVISGMADGDKLILRKVTDPNADAKSSSLTFTGDKVEFCPGCTFGSGSLTHVLDGTLTSYYQLTMPYGVEYGDNCFDTSKLGLFEGYIGCLRINTSQASLSEPGKGMSVWVSGIHEPNDLTALDVPYSVEVSNMQGYVNLVNISPKSSNFSSVAIEEPTINSPGQLNLEGSFKDMTQLTTVTLPTKRNIQVGDNAFSGCTALRAVNLGSCTTIGGNAFNGCTSLTSADLRRCTSIGASAFAGCSSLASVRLGVTSSLGAHCFDGTAIKSLVLKQPGRMWFDKEWVERPLKTENVLQGIEGLQTIVFEMCREADNSYYRETLASFRGELANLTTKPAVYINPDVLQRINVSDRTVGDITMQQYDDYRFMATATASGEALDRGYGTICLPRTVDMAASYNVKTLYTAQYDGASNAVTLIPVAAGGVQPGQPYIYSRSDDDPSGLVVFSGNDANGTAAEPLADGVLTGTFTATTAPVGSYVLQTDNMFHVVGSTSIAVAAYRAYMTAPAAGSAEARLSIVEGEPTAVKGVTDNAATATDADAPMYNLSGQRIAAPVKGQIYIVKGKKIIK